MTSDNILNFCSHIADIALKIKRKTYCIKRLFFLSTNVKLQFFKTFILPYFDYCLSLAIYFSKTAPKNSDAAIVIFWWSTDFDRKEGTNHTEMGNRHFSNNDYEYDWLIFFSSNDYDYEYEYFIFKEPFDYDYLLDH